METAILEARLKLKQRLEKSATADRPGGVRRKKIGSNQSQPIRNDDKAILACLKRFGVAPLHDVEEVHFDMGNGTVQTVRTPKVEASISACVYVVSAQ